MQAQLDTLPQPEQADGLPISKTLEVILIKNKVRLVLIGDGKPYQRLKPKNGITCFNSGSLEESEAGQLTDPTTIAMESPLKVSLILQFNDEGCQFKAIDGLERTIDEGAIPIPVDLALLPADSNNRGENSTVY